VRYSPGSNLTNEYLGKFETELENVLGDNLGPRGNLRKIEGRQSLDSVTLYGRHVTVVEGSVSGIWFSSLGRGGSGAGGSA
jgi:hypothetical protein